MQSRRSVPSALLSLFVLAMASALTPTVAGVSVAAVAATPAPTDTAAPGPCDTADILEILKLERPLRRHRSAEFPDPVATMLEVRLDACRHIIGSIPSPGPSGSPALIVTHPKLATPVVSNSPPPAACAPSASSSDAKRMALAVRSNDDVLALYNALAACVAFVKAIPTPGPSSTASPTPPAFALGAPNVARTKVIYALALATDAPTAAQLSMRLANMLAKKLSPQTYDPYTGQKISYRSIAQPLWTVAQYQQQCANDPSTAGAVVILPPGTQSASANALLWAWGWTTLETQAMVLDCEPGTVSFTNNASFVTWISHERARTGRRGGVPIATLLAGLAGFAALHPVHTTGTTTTYTAPSPTPSPTATYLSSVVQSDTTNTNPNGAGYLAASSIATSLTSMASANIGANGTIDSQTAGAAQRIAESFVDDLFRACDGFMASWDGTPDTLYDFLLTAGSTDESGTPKHPKYPTQCSWFYPAPGPTATEAP